MYCFLLFRTINNVKIETRMYVHIHYKGQALGSHVLNITIIRVSEKKSYWKYLCSYEIGMQTHQQNYLNNKYLLTSYDIILQ